MGYIRFPDTLSDDARVLDMSARPRNAALGVLVLAACWSSAHGTAGFVPTVVARHLGASAAMLAALLDAGLTAAAEGGIQIADWAQLAAGE